MGNTVTGGGAKPTINISGNIQKYNPSNKTTTASSYKTVNNTNSGDAMDFTDFIVTPYDMNTYDTKEVDGSLGIPAAEIKEKTWLEKFVSCGFSKCVYTYGNFMLSLNDGAIQLTEKIADGAIWSVKSIGGLHIGLASKAISLFNPELGKELEEANSAAQDLFKDIIGFSVTNWWRNLLSDNDGMRIINANSYLEYGGESSIKIGKVSEKIQTVVGAALSSKVWGGCLAILLGGCYGSGEQAEKLYSTRDETGVREELSILFSGGKEAMKWFTIAKLTQGISSMFKGGGGSAFGNFGENAKEFGRRTFENFKATNAEVFKSFKTSGGKGLFNPFSKYIGDFFSNPYNSAKTFGAFTRNFDDYFSGEKEFTIGSMLNDVIYSTSYMLSGAMRLNIGDNGDTYSVPQWGLTYLTPKLTDWFNKVFGIETIDVPSGDS